MTKQPRLLCPVCGETPQFARPYVVLAGEDVVELGFSFEHCGEERKIPVPPLDEGPPSVIRRGLDLAAGVSPLDVMREAVGQALASAPPPLTDEELAGIEHDLTVGTGGVPYLAESGLGQAYALRLVAEVRRLRSDEWIEAATLEIAGDPNCCDIQSSDPFAMETILRKHRDEATRK